MESRFAQADANGKITNAGEGCGFALLPGRARGDTTIRPGSYPVTVRTRSGRKIEVTGPHAFYFAALGLEKRQRFDIEAGADGARESWNIVSFDQPEDGIRIGGRSRITTQVQDRVAVPTIAPVGAVGFKVRPGTLSWNAIGGGTLRTCRLYTQGSDGVWTDTGIDLDFGATPVISRLVDSTGRIYLMADGASMTLTIEVTEEVG